MSFANAAARSIYCVKIEFPFEVAVTAVFFPRLDVPPEKLARRVHVMFHLVYASTATKPFTKPELRELLGKSERNNVKLGLTGMPLYKDGNFMQVLEGEKEVVMKLATTIEADTRHKGVIVLLQGEREQRDFPDWSMGFRDLEDRNTAKTPGDRKSTRL